jgi:N-carbamoyl-L-amino-acid hydrolase
MDQRHDALLAASELVLAVNAAATEIPGRQVATVGQIRAEPGAPNVIPGRVVLSIEVRDLDAAAVPALTDTRIQRIIDSAAHALGLTTRAMPSGAGHDAQDIARIAPMGMIFVPSVGGVSHAPREYTAPADIAHGVNVLMRANSDRFGGARSTESTVKQAKTRPRPNWAHCTRGLTSSRQRSADQAYRPARA